MPPLYRAGLGWEWTSLSAALPGLQRALSHTTLYPPQATLAATLVPLALREEDGQRWLSVSDLLVLAEKVTGKSLALWLDILLDLETTEERRAEAIIHRAMIVWPVAVPALEGRLPGVEDILADARAAPTLSPSLVWAQVNGAVSNGPTGLGFFCLMYTPSTDIYRYYLHASKRSHWQKAVREQIRREPDTVVLLHAHSIKDTSLVGRVMAHLVDDGILRIENGRYRTYSLSPQLTQPELLRIVRRQISEAAE